MSTSRATGDLAASVAANIRAARTATGLTQRELAAQVNDVDTLAVSRWERGLHRPTYENLLALAAALGRDVAWFYADHTNREAA